MTDWLTDCLFSSQRCNYWETGGNPVKSFGHVGTFRWHEDIASLLARVPSLTLTVLHSLRCCLGRVWVTTGRQVGSSHLRRPSTWPLHSGPERYNTATNISQITQENRKKPSPPSSQGGLGPGLVWQLRADHHCWLCDCKHVERQNKLVTSERWSDDLRWCWINYWSRAAQQHVTCYHVNTSHCYSLALSVIFSSPGSMFVINQQYGIIGQRLLLKFDQLLC